MIVDEDTISMPAMNSVCIPPNPASKPSMRMKWPIKAAATHTPISNETPSLRSLTILNRNPTENMRTTKPSLAAASIWSPGSARGSQAMQGLSTQPAIKNPATTGSPALRQPQPASAAAARIRVRS